MTQLIGKLSLILILNIACLLMKKLPRFSKSLNLTQEWDILALIKTLLDLIFIENIPIKAVWFFVMNVGQNAPQKVLKRSKDIITTSPVGMREWDAEISNPLANKRLKMS